MGNVFRQELHHWDLNHTLGHLILIEYSVIKLNKKSMESSKNDHIIGIITDSIRKLSGNIVMIGWYCLILKLWIKARIFFQV